MHLRSFALVALPFLAACTSTAAGSDDVDPAASEVTAASADGRRFRSRLQAVTELPDGSLLVVEGRPDEACRFSKLSAGLELDARFKQRQFLSGDVSTTLLSIEGGARFLTVTRDGRVGAHDSTTGAAGEIGGRPFLQLPTREGTDSHNLGAVVTKDGSVTLLLEEGRRRAYSTPTSYSDYGPSAVALATLDLTTGTLAKEAPIALPPSTENDGVRVLAFRALSDGSFAIAVEVVERPASQAARSRYLVVRSSGGRADPPAELLVTGRADVSFAGLHEDHDGSLTAVFTPGFRPPPEIADRMFAVSVTRTGVVAPMRVLGDATTSRCGDVAVGFADGEIVAVRSTVDPTKKDWTGKPSVVGMEVRSFSSADEATTVTRAAPDRCVKGVFPQPSGRVFVWATDTTQGLHDKEILFRHE